MRRGEILHNEGHPMGVDHIDELVGLHVEERLQLAFSRSLGALAPRAVHEQNPTATVTELLRLARVGAIAEAAAKADGAKPVRIVVHDARRRWRLELGII